MNKATSQQAFASAERLFAEVRMPENVQALAQQGLAHSKELFTKTSLVAQDGAKAMTEIADTAWGSTKMLHEKLVQNAQANAEVVFGHAYAIASAKSLPEIAKLQTELLQKLSAQAGEQTKEFFDLSTRASQHMLEKVQAAAKSLKPTA